MSEYEQYLNTKTLGILMLVIFLEMGLFFILSKYAPGAMDAIKSAGTVVFTIIAAVTGILAFFGVQWVIFQFFQ
jgi:hypothetical protein